ncbi:IS4 family transposase [Photobacterium sp. WH77]|uniref:IS4 family transposase n=1 Tax=unclassified Photobacterium TaxID=2628852 RepID=UPI001C44D94C|nr:MULTISPECIES: IS4 family transposase [unclassified Photobacterium]MBV7264535.1 IS4 family transposase [Photobacterium sp. WH24]MCG2839338.1 IS4 family transposase [Photobacterium sp. WH77]MCG2846954.1 IS4 family transposase [Photobacterium sp. WH80]MDO6583879.1 IS4 family transposase [Photobacterium sp. 2_MG-2023]
MTIISLKKQLMQFFDASFLEKTARKCGFTQRARAIQPQQLVLSLLAALSKGNCHAIADLHRQFNGMCLSEKQNVAYKPFHNQLRKDSFADFMKELVKFATVQLLQKSSRSMPAKLSHFDDVILQDGSSFRVHDGLREVFPSRFKNYPAAIECHMTMSLFDQSPKTMTVTADTASERTYLPTPGNIEKKLLLADAGYVDFSYFEQLSRHNGHFIVRGGKSLNPTIVNAHNGNGRRLPRLIDMKLKDISRKTNRSEVLDLRCKRGKYEFRVVRRWFAEEKRFCLWLTNLPTSQFSADDIMALYRCRWQIELLFKELKSHTNWRRFVTAQKAIAEGLIWASLLALIVRRSIAITSLPSVSVFKAAKNVDVWLLPILESLMHQARSEISGRLEWAMVYISMNARKAAQRKSKKDRTLDGIYEKLNA